MGTVSTDRCGGRVEGDVTHRRARTRRVVVVLGAFFCVAGAPALALDNCKAKVGKDGSIEFQGTLEASHTTPRWGWASAAVSLPFPNESSCYSGAKLTGCNIGQPGAGARRPPATCTIYATDSGGTICAAFIKGCVPGAQDVGNDGVVHIDQGRAATGGVTSADAPGFPVTLSDPGSYRLTGNLEVPAGVIGIRVTTSNVTIDLNGFTLRGTNTSAAPCAQVAGGNGIVADDATVRNTTVTNGNVQGFQFTGISLFGGTRIERVRAFWNCNVGMDVRADSFMLENQVYQNGWGIVIGASSLLRGNTAYGNDQANVRLLLPPTSTPVWRRTSEEWHVAAPITPPTIPEEQFAATGTDTFAADVPTVIGD